MKWFFVFMLSQLAILTSNAQGLTLSIGRAMDKLSQDEQFQHSLLAMYVKEIPSGRVIFEKNAQVGLAAASCQKVITSASSFALLGSNFRFVTMVGTDGVLYDDKVEGDLVIKGSGDPAMGSWRWPATTQASVFTKIYQALERKKIHFVTGSVVADDSKYILLPIPDGWIWQDIGNYYGAGAWSLNWHENQYDLHLRSSVSTGALTTVINTSPFDIASKITNMITSGVGGSGDNGYLYSGPFSERIFATGTIPPGQNDFVISGSLPDPSVEFSKDLDHYLRAHNIGISGQPQWAHHDAMKIKNKSFIVIDSIISPVFDSLNYWFLKKSVNLYGESFVKEIGFSKNGEGSTGSGLAEIKKFWQMAGLSASELNLMDGSGLSPANRITCHALVSILEFSRNQTWFNSFYNALPEMNGIKMKDGYINGVRSYTGFIKNKAGNTYCFAFIVNNFSGNPASVREKMWQILNLLK